MCLCGLKRPSVHSLQTGPDVRPPAPPRGRFPGQGCVVSPESSGSSLVSRKPPEEVAQEDPDQVQPLVEAPKTQTSPR